MRPAQMKRNERSICANGLGSSSFKGSRRVFCTGSSSTCNEHHCRILESGAALCRAKIARTPGGGGRGMVATQHIAAGDSVLEIAAANLLTVPKHEGAIDDWHKWLQLYTAAHGALPAVLVQFLGDISHHHSVRLAAWLLYLKQQCSRTASSSNSSSSSSSYWCSYIALLQQSGPMTAVCTGAWRQQELQLLEPAVLREWTCCHHRGARKAMLAAYRLLPGGHAETQLGLASSSTDVGWALALVKTRAHGDSDRLSLFPLHDMVNHREWGVANVRSGRATVTSPAVGYTLQAVTAIQSGEEITNCYTAYPMSNPQMLLGWGFTEPGKKSDWVMAVPLQYGTLPHIPWTSAVQAAANVFMRHQQQQIGTSCSDSTWQQHLETLGESERAVYTARLASAAANLPLQLPESLWDQGQSYKAAAAALSDQLSKQLCQQQQQQGRRQQQQPEDIFRPLIGSSEQQERIEALFVQDLHVCIQQLQQQQQQEGKVGVINSRNTYQQQQLQAWTAVAIHNACLIQTASCGTTARQDAILLQQVQGDIACVQQLGFQQQQQQQQHRGTTHSLLQQVQQLQQQLVHHLALLAACSNLPSMCEGTATAAEIVLQALQSDLDILQEQLHLQAWQSGGRQSKAAATKILLHLEPQIQQQLQQQERLLHQLLQLQELYQECADHSWSLQQQQQGSSAGGVRRLNAAQVSSAVAARLEQKQLLATTADLCIELHTELLTSCTDN